jgi:hypothetical protein
MFCTIRWILYVYFNFDIICLERHVHKHKQNQKFYGHTHIATDSANTLWQIRNSILYPQRMKRHTHAKLLKLSCTTSSYLKTPSISTSSKLMLYPECADAIAKCSAENWNGHDIRITSAPTPIHPYSGQQGWKTLPQLNYQILLTPANQGLQ